jgi:anti-sigma-K factor RskA
VAERDNLEALAAEYVLGTLDAGERSAAEARLAADAGFSAAVAAWERRLQPLSDALPPVEPPAGMFERIAPRLAAATVAPAAAGDVVALRRSLRRWRIGTAVAAAAALALFAVVVSDRSIPRPQSEFVAVLTADGAKPAFLATVDLANGTLSIRRVAAEAPADKSYELWAVEPDQAPRSLGVVENASLIRTLPVPARDDLLLAISLEPKGGSTTGAPTGPVLFTGPLIPAD